MSFKSEVDAEAEKLIKQGVSPLDALKQAIRIVTEKKISEIDQSAGPGEDLQKPGGR